MVKFSPEERDILHRVHLISGKPMNEITDMFEALSVVCVMAYLEKEAIVLPLFGKIDIEYKGDKLLESGLKEANLNIQITPGKFLKKVIGQIEDGDESEIEKILKGKIDKVLKNMLE